MSPRWLIAVPIALALGLAIGRYSRSPNVVTRDVVRTETQWKDREVVRVVHDVQTVHDVQVQRHVVTQWRTGPDKVTTVTQYLERDSQAETKRQDHTQGTKERQSEAHQATLETHTTESRPNWSVSVLAGVQDGGKRLVDALPAPAVVGVVVERRILGPVSIGAWGTTARAAGISARIDL